MNAEPQIEKIREEGEMSQQVQILGAAFNFEDMTVSVPQDKVRKAKYLIAVALALEWVPADLAQQTLGVLIFLSRILLSAQWHLSVTVRTSAIAVQKGVARVSELWKIELAWHDELYSRWNCSSMLVPRRYLSSNQQIHPFNVPASDASRSKKRLEGAAGMWFMQYYQRWDFTQEEILTLNIMELEGFALVVWIEYLTRMHPEKLQRMRFVMRCDNDPFVQAANKRKSSRPAVAFLLGLLHHFQALYHFDLKLVYIKSKDNIGADELSRGRLHKFFDFMSSTYHISQGELVEVPVNEKYRSYVSSAMRRSKLSPQALPSQPTQGEGRLSESGSSFARDSNSNHFCTHQGTSARRSRSGSQPSTKYCATPKC